MKRLPLFTATALLAFGTCAWAAEGGSGASTQTGPGTGRMQGSPNAAGFGKGEATGSTAPGAAGSDTRQDGRMQGSPNASGFRGGAAPAPAGSGR